MIVRIKRIKDTAILPEYQSDLAAAMDIHACIDEPVLLEPMQRAMIPTGFALELPPQYEAQVRARSGLSLKHGITLVNGIGTIDADFRGEINVLVINISQKSFAIDPQMRIAQMVIAPVERVVWNEVSALSDTVRGEAGYGSTKY